MKISSVILPEAELRGLAAEHRRSSGRRCWTEPRQASEFYVSLDREGKVREALR